MNCRRGVAGPFPCGYGAGCFGPIGGFNFQWHGPTGRAGWFWGRSAPRT